MRVLLINSNRFHQPWPVIPFGLCCVASVVEAAGHEVRALDLCFSRRTEREIAEAVREFGPDVVGVSVRNIDNCAGWNTRFLLDEVRDRVIGPLKGAFTGPIVIGGAAVGINAAEMLGFFGKETAHARAPGRRPGQLVGTLISTLLTQTRQAPLETEFGSAGGWSQAAERSARDRKIQSRAGQHRVPSTCSGLCWKAASHNM